MNNNNKPNHFVDFNIIVCNLNEKCFIFYSLFKSYNGGTFAMLFVKRKLVIEIHGLSYNILKIKLFGQKEIFTRIYFDKN